MAKEKEHHEKISSEKEDRIRRSDKHNKTLKESLERSERSVDDLRNWNRLQYQVILRHNHSLNSRFDHYKGQYPQLSSPQLAIAFQPCDQVKSFEVGADGKVIDLPYAYPVESQSVIIQESGGEGGDMFRKVSSVPMAEVVDETSFFAGQPSKCSSLSFSSKPDPMMSVDCDIQSPYYAHPIVNEKANAKLLDEQSSEFKAFLKTQTRLREISTGQDWYSF